MRLSILAVLATTAGLVAGAGQCADLGAPTPPIRLVFSSPDLRAALDRAQVDGSTIERPIEAKTAVAYRFAPKGLTGEAGYLCGIGGIGPDGEVARVGPASAFQNFGTFLGATLAYAFR
ncbi:MAG TPA: hypothetical protein VIJ59_05380 [Caulobacteraceae bacterium]